MVALRLRAGGDEVALVGLPWEQPLADWPSALCVQIPAGNHRHVVRFLPRSGTFFALKELPERLARREYDNLERLREENLPAVTLVGIATDRNEAHEDELESVLITRHLQYSLPYRQLFIEPHGIDAHERLIDALTVLLVRLHTDGFYWGDCSLNNALFRRDAGSLRAYVVDTETSEWHESLSDGQRRYDLEIACENVLGGLLDLEAEGVLGADADPAEIALRLRQRYESLWNELTAEEEIPISDLHRIHARLARLNELGFDTEEYELRKSDGIARFRPTIVEEGHHKRELERLTGIVAHENQARRLLAAMRGYGAWLAETEGRHVPDAVIAYRWLTERWQVALEHIPAELRARHEDAELYHEILDHGWYLAERRGSEVPLVHVVESFVAEILSTRTDERTLLAVDTPREAAVGSANRK